MDKTITANITEIFSSIQGEGIFAGAKQVFVRFFGCNMRCRFCDEAAKTRTTAYSPGSLMAAVRSLEAAKGRHHSVSLTGGEPLLHTEFLKQFLPLLKAEKHKVYLETNGTLPGALSEVIGDVDIIAMDFKLPSSTGDRPYWEEHAGFLKAAMGKKVFVKAVVTYDTSLEDIRKAAELIKTAGADVPLILQPATPISKTDAPVPANRLVTFLEAATEQNVENVRIVPQIHRFLNIH